MQSDFVNVTMLLTQSELQLLRMNLNDKLASCLLLIDRLDPDQDPDLIRRISNIADLCNSILDQLPYPEVIMPF